MKAARPDIKVEGPIQYDAAIDPKVRGLLAVMGGGGGRGAASSVT